MRSALSDKVHIVAQAVRLGEQDLGEVVLLLNGQWELVIVVSLSRTLVGEERSSH